MPSSTDIWSITYQETFLMVIDLFSRNKFNQSWNLKANNLLWYMLQSIPLCNLSQDQQINLKSKSGTLVPCHFKNLILEHKRPRFLKLRLI